MKKIITILVLLASVAANGQDTTKKIPVYIQYSHSKLRDTVPDIEEMNIIHYRPDYQGVQKRFDGKVVINYHPMVLHMTGISYKNKLYNDDMKPLSDELIIWMIKPVK